MGRFKGFTDKQMQVLCSPAAKIEIHHGPVRTGKTVVAGARLFQNMCEAVMHQKLPCVSAAAKNRSNCHKTIAGSLRDVFGERIVPRTSEGADSFSFRVDNGSYTDTVEATCLGWSTVHAENGLYGLNIDGSVIDEVVLAPESFFQVNVTRLDRPWARLICTTNPQSNRHWLKKNFIDKADGLYIKEVPWKHSDNPHLTQEYLDMLDRTLHGVYHRRLVLGEWCSADGMIYPFLNESYISGELSLPCATGYVVGFDFGLKHKTAAVLIGYNPYTTPPAWVADEFVCEPSDGHVYTLNDIVMRFWAWLGGRHPDAVYVDPSALVLKNELYRNNRGISILDANNDVQNGIHCVMSMISGREVAISTKCQRLLDEMYNYCWDAKKSDTSGRDVPVKENDDLCDALRYALYTHWGSDCEVSRHKPLGAQRPTVKVGHDLRPSWIDPMGGIMRPF